MSRYFYVVEYEAYPGRTELSRSFALLRNARKLAEKLRGRVRKLSSASPVG